MEAIVRLEMVIDDTRHPVDFVVDTGFSGYLSVSERLVRQLSLRQTGTEKGITADGRSNTFPTFGVQVMWDGQIQSVSAPLFEAPMIGTRMMLDYELRAIWIPTREVIIHRV